MTQRERRQIVRSALRGVGMRCVSSERLVRQERPLSLPWWPGRAETLIARSIEYHAARG